MRKLTGVLVALLGLLAGAAPAHAEDVTVTTLDFDVRVGENTCAIVGDLYRPASASAAHPAPALLATNGFGGSKDDQAKAARFYAERGYVVLSYSGLGFGGSTCKISLDDPDADGRAASQLVTFLGGGSAARDGTRIDYVRRDAVGSDGKPHDADPRVGMFGFSYGGGIQFAVASVDPRVDALVPGDTWNDLSYSLAPNNAGVRSGVTSQIPGAVKSEWLSLLFAAGVESGGARADNDPSRLAGCPNFTDAICTGVTRALSTGTPSAETIALLQHASVAHYIDRINVPVLLLQGQLDTLFNLQESVATYRALKAQGTPVKLAWMQSGHSGITTDEDQLQKLQGQVAQQVAAWLDHYVAGVGPAPALDFSFYRDWTGKPSTDPAAWASAPAYPLGTATELRLSGKDQLVGAGASVVAGSADLVTPGAGAPTSYTETSSQAQTQPVIDAPGSTVRFDAAPVSAPIDIVGSATARLHLRSAADEVVLFVKLYDVAPDGTIDLPRRLISPIRVPGGDRTVDVELPAIVHRLPAGHHLALVIAGGDAAYRGSASPTAVTVVTDPSAPSTLTVPTAQEGTDYGASPPATARACTSRRVVTAHLPARLRRRALAVTVRVPGRPARRLGRTAARRALPIDLRGLSVATVRVRLDVRVAGRRTVKLVRRYKVCGAR